MERERAGQLVGRHSFEIASRGEVVRLPIALGQHAVRDLADQGLDECVLAPLGRARIGDVDEELAPDEVSQVRLELLFRIAGHGGKAREREALAEYGRDADEGPLCWIERVEPRGDQRLERLRHRERREVLRRDVAITLERKATLREERAHRLDGVERDPVGPPDDGAHGVLRQPGDEAGEQLAHRLLRERLEVEGREVPLPGAPVRPPLEQLRARQRDDEDRAAARPLEHVLDEVERARSRPSAGPRRPGPRVPSPPCARRRCARRRTAARSWPTRCRCPSSASIAGSIQRRSASSGTCSTTIAAIRSRVVASSSFSARPARPRIISPSAQNVIPSPYAGERPRVPPDRLDDPVDVLQELPAEPALADAGGAHDADQADPPLAAGGVEELLQEPKLDVAADERRLERVGTTAPTPLGHDTSGTPRRESGGLALQLVFAGGLEGDRRAGGAHGRLADEDRARIGDALEPGGGVDEVAGDHALVRCAERDRRLPGQDPGARLDAGPQAANRVDQVERRPHAALGVILLRSRGTPHGHDRVADELLDGSPIPRDDLRGEVEVAGERLPNVLRVAFLGEGREADEVREEDRYEPALRHWVRSGAGGCSTGRGCGRGSRERRPARPAELRLTHSGRAARLALLVQPRAAFEAEPRAGRVIRVAARARHARNITLSTVNRGTRGPYFGAGLSSTALTKGRHQRISRTIYSLTVSRSPSSGCSFDLHRAPLTLQAQTGDTRPPEWSRAL